jgi:hypothetical protein
MNCRDSLPSRRVRPSGLPWDATGLTITTPCGEGTMYDGGTTRHSGKGCTAVSCVRSLVGDASWLLLSTTSMRMEEGGMASTE